MYNLVSTYGKSVALFLYLMPDYSANALYQLLQMEGLLCQAYLTSLNSAHIQNLIEKLQKMLTGDTDLVQTVLYFLRIACIGLGDGRHSHNGVHGCADIVGHSGKKICFCLIGCLGGFIGCQKSLTVLLILFTLYIHIPHEQKEASTCILLYERRVIGIIMELLLFIPHAQLTFQTSPVPVTLLTVNSLQFLSVLLADTLLQSSYIIGKTAVPINFQVLLRAVYTVILRLSHVYTDSQRIHSGYRCLGDHLVIMLLHLRVLVIKSHYDNGTFPAGHRKRQEEELSPVS